MASSLPKLDSIYEFLVDEEDARVCKDIPDSACEVVPNNFFLILASQWLTKLADSLANAKTVLPWLMKSTGAPEALIGLLVPIRESGSLIPQLMIGGFIRSHKIRKFFYVAGSLGQALFVLQMLLAAVFFEGWTAGLLIIFSLMLFSLSRGLCSISSKDVVGKTVPKTRRGRLSGISASVAGLLTIGVAVAMHTGLMADANNFNTLLIMAGLAWICAALVFACVKESPGATDGGGNALRQAFSKFSLLKTDHAFRRFVIIRALLMSSGLAAPFLVTMANQSENGTGLISLSAFVALSGLAGLVSGPLWGKLSDWNSLLVMAVAAASCGLICFCSVVVLALDLPSQDVAGLGLFFLLALCHEGVRLGRKTYLVDMASGNKRTDYVALSNTIIGILLLVVGVATAVIAHFSLMAVLGVFGLTCIIAAMLSRVEIKRIGDTN